MIKQIDFNLENCREYLFYQVNSDEEVARNEIGLLENSQVFGLLSMVVIEKEKEVSFRYDLSSWEHIKPLFYKGFSKERLYKFLLHIVETLFHSQKIGLRLGNIVADQRHIYIDPLSGRPLFFYLPIKDNRYESGTVKEFLLSLLWMAPYDEEDDLSFFMKIHNYLVRAEEIDLLDFKGMIEELGKDLVEPLPMHNVTEVVKRRSFSSEPARKSIGFYSPGNAELLLEDQNKVTASSKKSVKENKQTGQKLEIEEEIQYKRVTRTELGETNAAAAIAGTQIHIVPGNGKGMAAEMDFQDEGTTVLGVSDAGTTTLGVSAPMPFLLTLANREKITVAKDVFKLGRDPKNADYKSSNKAVGRIHAHILTEDGEYFLQDNRSTNGSFVNDIKLAKSEKVKIKHDDRITLANEEFVFKLF
ncbi:Forkhead-associated protein [Neobacillus bataviensis LMG 21833]|uniref:Forkhead-associated protein n=1 Tax=Neobacillus bataviensis LMG 21833 TaxID=1117379 RepID=K6EDI3_9BACI|nr:DUF6382 domain-containing protein [Neobacillus bataviensis]EKN71486.1 Forkhead-associated protein [Neobacillus bataviensis LMG 21833]